MMKQFLTAIFVTLVLAIFVWAALIINAMSHKH